MILSKYVQHLNLLIMAIGIMTGSCLDIAGEARAVV